MKTIITGCFLILHILSCGEKTSRKDNKSIPGGQTPSQTDDLNVDGTINGGGGIGIRCQGKLELLDLYEARKSGLSLIKPLASQQQATIFVADRMARHFWNPDTIPHDEYAAGLRKYITTPIFEGKAFMNYGTEKMEDVTFVNSLPLSNDLGKVEVPKNCGLEQVAYFSDSKTSLSIVEAAWNEMDWLSKSALVTHELLYLVDRRYGFENMKSNKPLYTSEQTRKIVGHLMSTTPFPTHSDGLPNRSLIETCSTDISVNDADITYFYAFENPTTKHLSLIFNQIYDYSSNYQMRADFQTILSDQVKEKSRGLLSETTALNFSGSGMDYGFKVNLSRANDGKLDIQVSYPMEDGLWKEGTREKIFCD